MRISATDKMLLARTLLLCSLWCIVMTTTAAAALEESVGGEQNERWRTVLQKDTQTTKAATETAATAAATTKAATQSTIYKIKRLRTKDQTLGMQQQQQQQQNKLNNVETTSSASSSSAMAAGKPTRAKKPKNLSKNSHGLNKQLLNKMGFIKVKAPNSHNRKRLAVESRRHASRDDSHMFIIKLPPNLYYYTGPKSAVPAALDNSMNSLLPAAQTKLKDAFQQQQQQQHHHHHQHHQTQQQQQQQREQQQHKTTMHSGTAAVMETTLAAEALNANGKKVSFPFSSNGRPGRIYHWNLPVLKKALDKKERFAHVPEMTKKQLLDIKDIPTWSKGKPWENETIEKPFSSDIGGNIAGNAGGGNMFVAGNKSSYKKSLKTKSPSYYAPSNAVNKNSFNKYFAGNGKPKGFYVIKENQKKPLYYKNIIS